MQIQDFTKLETAVLLTMVAAHSAYYGRVLTMVELRDCQVTILQLQAEINSRYKILQASIK